MYWPSRERRSSLLQLVFPALSILITTSTVLLAAALPSRVEGPRPLCGSTYAPPFANQGDAAPRVCSLARPRNYTPKHRGIGFEILDLESDACFVSDDSYRLLDEIVEGVSKRVPLAQPSDERTKVEQVYAVSRATGDVLAEKGFGLYIPTETLGDALVARNAPGEAPRHIFDCDTGSMILLTVAESLSLAASLVEITLPSGSGHNYVRWHISDTTSIDWDTNGRAPCTTPSNLPSFQGKSLTRDQTISYVLAVRAQTWERKRSFVQAIADYRDAIRLFPDRPGAFNNFAWLIATKEFEGRSSHKAEGLRAANEAVALQRTPNHLDTLACVSAFLGDFNAALNYESEALRGEPSNEVFKRRLEQFQGQSPKDCTGAD